MEATLSDMRLVQRLREGHHIAVAHSARGELGVVFALSPDEPETHVYVVKVLDVHPALGKVAGRRLMAELGIHQFARVSHLSDQKKSLLLTACGEKK